MHEHDTGDFSRECGGQAEPREDARGFSLIRQALEEEGLDRGGGRKSFCGVDRRRCSQIGERGDLLAQAGKVGGGRGGDARGGGEGGEMAKADLHAV